MALLEMFLFLCIVSVVLSSRTVHSIPFVVFHGVSDSCDHEGVTHFNKVLGNWSGSPGYCIEIGNGAWDSLTVPFRKQTAIACKKGNIVGRGVIEFCDGGPPGLTEDSWGNCYCRATQE